MADTVTIQVQDSLGVLAFATFTIPPALAATTPTFSPVAGTYSSAKSVSISADPGAIIYFTTDGSTPTPSSAVYSAPLSVSANETIKAIATVSGYLQSAVGTAAYVFVAPPVPQWPNPLPSGTVGSFYSFTLTATGGVPPYTYSITSGTLPAGLSLNGSTGLISGTPTTQVSLDAVTFAVTDSG